MFLWNWKFIQNSLLLSVLPTELTLWLWHIKQSSSGCSQKWTHLTPECLIIRKNDIFKRLHVTLMLHKHNNIMTTVYPLPNSRTRILPKSCIYFSLAESPTSHPQAHHFKWNMALVLMYICLGFPGGASGEEPSAKVGDIRDVGWIPGSGRTPGEGHDNPLQYFCLENSTQREAWRATVHGVAKSQIQLRRLSTHMHLYLCKSPIVCLRLFCALCEWHIAFCHLPLNIMFLIIYPQYI